MKHFYSVILFLAITLISKAQQTATANTNWLLTGNSNANITKDFLGTKDKNPFAIRTNNVERLRITNGGLIGIGTKAPYGKLNISGGNSLSLSEPGFFVIGDSSQYNLGIDYYNIQARNKGSYSDLFLNPYGGSVIAGNTSTSYYGILAEGSADGVYGESPGGTGVYGTGGNYGVQGNTTNGSGVYGSSTNGTGVSGSGANTGVFGSASGSGSIGLYGTSPNIGVYGLESENGTAVYGVDEALNDNDGNGTGVDGRSYTGYGVSGSAAHGYGVYGSSEYYAGYFNGNVYATGTYTSSDATLKQNITDMQGAMNIINQLKPKYYNFRSDGDYKRMNLPQGQHYGLIAQDVEKVLPGLVKDTKFDAGRAVQSPEQLLDSAHKAKLVKPAVAKRSEIIDFKALNYTELIPIIIKGMQELQQTVTSQNEIIMQQQQQINQLLALNASALKTTTISSGTTGVIQNAPNPFSSSTIISYSLPQTYSSAQIIITDKNGSTLKQIPVSGSGKGNVTLDASTLPSGTYYYSLLVDGKLLITRQMVLAK